MPLEFEGIFKVAEKRMARLAYTVWDIIEFPNVVHFDQANSSYRFSYDLHTTLFGPPNKELLEEYDPKGEISLSFDPEWLSLIREYFTDFKVMDKSVRRKDINTFLCLELVEKDFSPKNRYESLILDDVLSKLLSFKQRMLLSNSAGGGVGITKNNQMVAVAFAPHLVTNDRFSFAIIRGIWVLKEYRNKGYGYDVSAKICQELFSKNIGKITLWVEESNTPALQIYDKMGFKIVDKVLGTDCIKYHMY